LKEEISRLISLQEIDLELAGFDRLIEQQRQVLSQREQAIAEKEEAIAERQAKIESLTQQQRTVKLEGEDAGSRIKDRQNKMMQVQTSREHQALLKEIEENKKLLKDSEEQQLQCEEQIIQINDEIEEMKNLCTGERELLSQDNDKVAKEIKRIENQKKSVIQQRETLAKELPGNQLKRYNKLLNKRNGLAVVATIEGVCQGCFMTIPPQQFNEVRKGDKLNLCPTCQRILFFKEPEAEEVEQ
jgi:uncharacterized protein